MKEIEMWTDGACSGNPGKGGWAAILKCDDNTKIISGGVKLTTNNIMELMAVVQGLKALKEPCNVKIYSDSAYVVNAFVNGWIENWRLNAWRNAKKQEVANKFLWQELLRLMETHTVHYIKVKGHSDNPNNNMCDYIARCEIGKI